MEAYQYAKIYYFYQSALVRSIRLLILIGLFLSFTPYIFSGKIANIPLFFLSLFLMWETFFYFKIARTPPTISVTENDGKKILSSATTPVLYASFHHDNTTVLTQELLTYPQAQFVLYKAAITQKEFPHEDMEKEKLLQEAMDVARITGGTFITTMDVVGAYLLLTEGRTKLLFSKNIKPQEFLEIVRWARFDFPHEETPKKLRIHFAGGGLGEALVTGWTLETKKYTKNFSITSTTKPLLVGRQQEYKRMRESLIRKENNNVLLVGDIGSGKENLVTMLAWDSYEGDLEESLNFKWVLELMVGPLIAGAENRGALEMRLQAIIEEVSHAGNVILYIPEFQNIMGASSFALDLSGALYPHLRSGRLPIIATTTSGNYKVFVEHKPIQKIFEIIPLEEPTKSVATQMVLEKTGEIEKKYNVIIAYRAVVAAIEFAKRYLQDSILPGNAITLLTDTANSVSLASTLSFGETKKKIIQEENVIQKIEEEMHVAVAAPVGKEKELLLHLEDKLHERVIDQEEGIRVIAEAMRRLRSGLASLDRPISFLFLGPTGVGKTETARALASLYYGGEGKIVRLDMSEYSDDNGVKRLLGAEPGEGEERGELTDKIHDNPFSLVLLDEFEKAHPRILDLFLQVLEDGRLTDNKGKTVSFANALVIATSNAGSEFIREEIGKGTPVDKAFHTKLLDALQTKGIFKPELLNRFDAVVTFKPLTQKEITQIIKLMLKEVKETLLKQDITLLFDEKVIAKITTEGFDKEFGARPLRRYIQDTIEDFVAKKKLEDQIQRGSTVTLSTDDKNNLTFSIS